MVACFYSKNVTFSTIENASGLQPAKYRETNSKLEVIILVHVFDRESKMRTFIFIAATARANSKHEKKLIEI